MSTTGSVQRTPMAPTEGRSRMWQSMRMLRRFSTAEVQATAEVSAVQSRRYIYALLQNGYVRQVQPRQYGVPCGHPVYLLIRDTGPHAPRIGKQQLRDPNLLPHYLTAGEKPVVITRNEYERAMRCVRACAGMTDPECEIATLRKAVSA